MGDKWKKQGECVQKTRGYRVVVNRKKVVEMPECFASKKAPVHTVVLERASKTDFVQGSTNTLCINFMNSSYCERATNGHSGKQGQESRPVLELPA